MSLGLLFLIIALVLFILAAVEVASPFSLGWAGMAFLTAAMIAGSAVLS